MLAMPALASPYPTFRPTLDAQIAPPQNDVVQLQCTDLGSGEFAAVEIVRATIEGAGGATTAASVAASRCDGQLHRGESRISTMWAARMTPGSWDDPTDVGRSRTSPLVA